MKTKKLIALALVGAICAGISSCQKEELTPSIDQTELQKNITDPPSEHEEPDKTKKPNGG